MTKNLARGLLFFFSASFLHADLPEQVRNFPTLAQSKFGISDLGAASSGGHGASFDSCGAQHPSPEKWPLSATSSGQWAGVLKAAKHTDMEAARLAQGLNAWAVSI